MKASCTTGVNQDTSNHKLKISQNHVINPPYPPFPKGDLVSCAIAPAKQNECFLPSFRRKPKSRNSRENELDPDLGRDDKKPDKPDILFCGGYIWTAWFSPLLSALIVFMILSPARHFDFINFDDPLYITQNPHVIHGLTQDAFLNAWIDTSSGHWHPLTWISHQLDVTLFGLNPYAHHTVSLGPIS